MSGVSVYDQMTKSEKEVANLLKNLGIQWTYEQPVFDYDYRRKIFDKNGYRVIFLHLFKDTDKWINHLLNYLRLFTVKRNNKLNEILRMGTENDSR